MKTFLLVLILALSSAHAKAAVVYQQSPNPAGGFHVSAWWDPDGSNYDRYIWDSFTLDASAAIDSIEWRGTYGASGPAYDFTVAIYASIAAGTQPDFSQPPLFESQAGSDCGATYAGDFGGAPMYDYAYRLPAPFAAQAGVRYWIEVAGWQSGFPDWGLADGLGGNGSHFLCEHNNLTLDFGVPTGCRFTSRTGDMAFTLLASGAIGVVPGAPAFALHRVFPNPTTGRRLEVSFSLAGPGGARLALVDVAGRSVRTVEVGALGAGPHVVDLAGGAVVPPGLYFVRLSRAGQKAMTRVCVTR